MDTPFIQKFLKIKLDGRYQFRRRLASGTFGEVYVGRDVVTGEEVAIKLEHHSTDFPRLLYEVDVYESLKGHCGFPQVFWHGSHGDYNAMVFELLGPNLEDVLCFCDSRFSLKTVLMLMDQLLHRLEHLHAAGYIHRDIKPENFLLGAGKRGNTVFVTDFGLVRRWSRERSAHDTQQKAAEPHRVSLAGTRNFASINSHFGAGTSPRDDLESLGYVALYFLRGSLRWQGMRASSREAKDRLVLEQKQNTTVEELCDGQPTEFAIYMSYVRALSTSDWPDYRFLRNQFSRLFRQKGFENDNVFDWTIQEFAKQCGECPEDAV